MKKDNEGNRQAHWHSPMEAVVGWKKHHFTEKSFLLILAVVVGLLSGAGAYVLFFPVLITAAISYATVTLFSRHSFYTKRAPRHFRLQK